MEYSDDSAPLS